MSIKTKQRLLTVLKTFNYIGLVILLFVTFTILGQIRAQAVENQNDIDEAVVQIKKDHDLQNRYLRCLVDLFINSDSDEVTPEQSALCLAEVRKGTTKTTTIEPTAENGQTTTTTTTNQSSPNQPAAPQNSPQTNTALPKTTTSAPPDPPSENKLPGQAAVENITGPIFNTLRGIL